jgi:predicted kinase
MRHSEKLAEFRTAAPLLTPQQRRAARHLADLIVAGYRADLLRDMPAFVEAVAEELAALTGTDVAEATVTLIEEHRALADWPAEIPPRPVRDRHAWRPARMVRRETDA